MDTLQDLIWVDPCCRREGCNSSSSSKEERGEGCSRSSREGRADSIYFNSSSSSSSRVKEGGEEGVRAPRP